MLSWDKSGDDKRKGKSKINALGLFSLSLSTLLLLHQDSVVMSVMCKFSLPLQTVRVPAIGEAKAVDATGAGDLFASGFLYGLVKGLSLEECCKVGSCSGGSVIRALGGEVTPENWQWMYKQMQTKGLTIPSNAK